MAQKENTENRRRLTFVENTTNFKKAELPEMKGWTVMNREDQNIGRVEKVIGDVENHNLRYVDIRLNEDQLSGRNTNGNAKNLSLPVGLGTLDREQQRLVLDKADPDLIEQVPLHESGKILNYEDELKIRAIFEKEDKTDLKSGKNRPAGPGKIVEKQGESINEKIIDPDEGHKRDKDVNEGFVADTHQGQYTPNLTGDQEGIKSRGTNTEGKHDITASSDNPESPNTGNPGNELSSAAAPDSTEVPSTDKPGETLGRAEVDNKYREPENEDLPKPHGPPEIPLNANDDFYRHEMFDVGHLMGR